MTAVSSSRAVCVLLLTLLSGVSVASAGDVRVPLLPTSPAEGLATSNDGHDTSKLILVAGEEPGGRTKRPEVTSVSEGSSSRRARSAAIADLELGRLPWQNRQLVQDVVDEVSIFRRLPAFRCEVDPQVHEYFVNHPEVAVGIWRAMGISQLQMWSTGEWSYGMDTKDGTTGTIHVLYRSRESCLILCKGMFKSPYLQNPIAANSVMHLQTRFTTGENGRTYAIHHADMFVSFPSQKVETVAKLISPLSNVIIDRNFQEISLFIHVMWLAMGRQPGWVEQIASKLDGVDEKRRDELIKLTARVYVDTQKARRARAGEAVTLDAIRPPASGDSASSRIQTTEGVRTTRGR